MDDNMLPDDVVGPLRPARPVRRQLESFSLAFSNAARPEYELGDKILLPQSLLAELIQWNTEDPMIFRLQAQRSERVTHVGVIEFTAEEGKCYLPHWLMQNLALQEGDVVQLETASLPKARYVKLQPHLTEFTQMTNPRAVLETRLRHYTALTEGDEIAIEYNGKMFWLTVIACEPASAVCVTDTDVSVEFAPPRDMPPEMPAVRTNAGMSSTSQCAGRIEFGDATAATAGEPAAATTSRSLWRRKNEKAASGDEGMTTGSRDGVPNAPANAQPQHEDYWSKLSGGRTLSGRPVFSSDSPRTVETSTGTPSRPKAQPTSTDGPKKFVPFSGTGRTLR
jgi:ubiquitin fusion degradation protein 1